MLPRISPTAEICGIFTGKFSTMKVVFWRILVAVDRTCPASEVAAGASHGLLTSISIQAFLIKSVDGAGVATAKAKMSLYTIKVITWQEYRKKLA